MVITGGASGLGLLIAQMYGMRGASVAVLDIKDVLEDGRDEVFGEGVLYISCDVAERTALESAKRRILQEVCLIFDFGFVVTLNPMLYYEGLRTGDLDGWV